MVEGNKRILAVDRLEGMSAAALLNHLESVSERLADAAVFHLGCQLMKIVAAAHGWRDDGGVIRPLVHGMLGPRQVHVSWTGEVRVLGFGLVALYRLAPDPPWDEGGAYLAPEVRAGRMATARADVYSAARVIWGLLTQRRMGNGQEPEPLRSLRPDLDTHVAQAIDRALEASTANRTISCQEIAEQLEEIADAHELEWNMELMRAVLPSGLEEASAEGAVGMVALEPDSADGQPTAVRHVPPNFTGPDLEDIDPPSSDDDEQPTAIMTLPEPIARPKPRAAIQTSPDEGADRETPLLDDHEAWTRDPPAKIAPKVEPKVPKEEPREKARTTLDGGPWTAPQKKIALRAQALAKTDNAAKLASPSKVTKPSPLRREDVNLPPLRSKRHTVVGLGAGLKAAQPLIPAEPVVPRVTIAKDKPSDQGEPPPAAAKEIEKAPVIAEKIAERIAPKIVDKPAVTARGPGLRTTLRSARSELIDDPPPEEAAPTDESKPESLPAIDLTSDAPSDIPVDSEPPLASEETIKIPEDEISEDENSEDEIPQAQDEAEIPKVEIPREPPPLPPPPARPQDVPVFPAPPSVRPPSLRPVDVLSAQARRLEATLDATSRDTKAPPPARRRGGTVAALLAVAIVLGAAVAIGMRFWPQVTDPVRGAGHERTDAPVDSAPAASTGVPTPSAATSIAPPPIASAEASAMASASASAAPVTDPARLPPNRAHLVVDPPLAGLDVFVNGTRAGSAEETLVVPCKGVGVMLMSADKQWKSRVRPMTLVCRRLNRLTIEPTSANAPQKSPVVPKPVGPTPVPRPKPGSQFLKR